MIVRRLWLVNDAGERVLDDGQIAKFVVIGRFGGFGVYLLVEQTILLLHARYNQQYISKIYLRYSSQKVIPASIMRYVEYLYQMERPLHNFLNRLAKQAVKDFVIGNSSVDYDSFFGSIIFAYLLTSTTGRLHMPIIDCPQDQIKSVLDKVKLDTNQLLFRQSSETPFPFGTYNLYDHNHRNNLEHDIEYIVDHHNDTHSKGRKKLISTMGSGLTLLYYLLSPVRMIKDDEHGFQGKYYEFVKGEGFEDGQQISVDDEIKEIILYGILMDTFNLDEKQRKRWTVFDKNAVKDLIQDLPKQQIWDFEILTKKKNDVQESKKLTLKQQLGKDRKKQQYGPLTSIYSTILLDPQDFYHHYQMETAFSSNAQPSDIYFIMAVFQNEQGAKERQLIFKVTHPDRKSIQAAINNCLGGLAFEDLGLLGEWKRWRDPSRTISRKVLEPIIRKQCMQLNITKQAEL